MEPNSPWSPPAAAAPTPATWAPAANATATGPERGERPTLPPPSESPFGEPRKPLLKRIGGSIAVVAAMIGKFLAQIKGLIFLLPKIKLLTFAGSAVISVVAYSLFFGWTFAIGFVVLLFVHEMGHVIQLRREGIKASLPFFIPFLGAVVMADLMSGDALREAKVGLAGPILGTVGAAVCLLVFGLTGNEFWRALAYVGFLINLFNLLPVLPLDGGRAMSAMAPWMWFVGFVALIPAAIFLRTPLIFLVIVVGGFETWSRWKKRGTRTLEQSAYYRVSPRNRLLVGAVYIGLIAVLAVGMSEAFVARSIS